MAKESKDDVSLFDRLELKKRLTGIAITAMLTLVITVFTFFRTDHEDLSNTKNQLEQINIHVHNIDSDLVTKVSEQELRNFEKYIDSRLNNINDNLIDVKKSNQLIYENILNNNKK